MSSYINFTRRLLVTPIINSLNTSTKSVEGTVRLVPHFRAIFGAGARIAHNGRCISTSNVLYSITKEAEGHENSNKEKGKVGATGKARIEHISETFKPGKYGGRGLPNPVGQPDDLPSIEFGKPTGMYNFIRHQHGDPRGHLGKDGRYQPSFDSDEFHWFDAYTNVPKQKFKIVNGESMVVGVETRPMEELFGLEQTNIPFTPRTRMGVWGNHKIILGAEFCFFWLPTFIIFSLAIPCYTMLYMMDESVYTTMTVKVVGHQWYWVYEVESPPLEEEE
ncbi:cytochrome c oxidase subunit II precursor, putative [Theileria equi strain WA]|uniref:Cytochrome c oxidase subunit II, putative n=1 Tax=Theileria equi strain WA TaxID=1537102 RepID=L0AZ57_THEEQ|nr:cytochrome c oxidase subunit II precursor, putative [Theileria equi strain WA]AFZ80528.1 cytochrome c oxidase subunit II precursor, putative [Theileria equi strain WA]|eukprot:XP_004830194.1 cytochrome c oxidase subunit II precursor, putative [Theileria equi strain WA]